MNFKMVIAGAAMALGLALGPAEANANVTYIYTGSPFTEFHGAAWTGADRLTGSMVLSAPLPANFSYFQFVTPVSITFSDGIHSVSNTSPLRLGTDAAGIITAWEFIYNVDHIGQITSNTIPIEDNTVFDSSGQLAISHIAGSWSLADGVPEPASWALMLIGFGVVGGGLRMARRKHETARTAA